MTTVEDLKSKLEMLQFLMAHARTSEFAERGPFADPTKGQGRVLAFLKLHDGVSAKELRTILGIGVSSLNEILQKLEKAGMIERRQSDADGRVVLVYLTDEGRAQEQARADIPDLFSDFSQEELDQMGVFLDRMLQTLEAQMGDGFKRDFEEEWEQRQKVFAQMFGEDWQERAGERLGGDGTFHGSMPEGFPGFADFGARFRGFGGFGGFGGRKGRQE